ncbi:biotin synthase auxiliary protein BsaP [Rhodococcus chondri]|uniref:Biotin synthase auxiliary protein n=1 Tax=Rhodococcus chondri TaxID=3065941 RepID=A0ABU7JY30_9NOCA|nr:hypothetical protein [Rhodococcus sp. CC-R104]MEE2034824.1 hypothetical protein [Rhodococcus sp. CC-R104]
MFDPYTGAEAAGGSALARPVAARLGLEPPRYCTQCGRRMIVQIAPDGWWARCSRHGTIDSSLLEQR